MAIKNRLWMDKIYHQTLKLQQRNENMVMETMRKEILYTLDQIHEKINSQNFRMNDSTVAKTVASLVAKKQIIMYRDIDNVKHFIKFS